MFFLAFGAAISGQTLRIPGVPATTVGRAFLREAEIAVSASRRARATARAGADELVGELVVAVQMGFGTPPSWSGCVAGACWTSP
ncbi:hypothetical protein ACTXG6_06740 [Pseudonocardia sp. Cha107L01]|jgi:DNA-binding transcriptional LysR family regulator|uniref:hypothetical protein n=1 Tax=Pseudonocardia sp. Cha107L01 TaxID=3457576 RepID=UPI00403E537F